MIDFDKLVSSMLDQGISAEDAAKQFTDALNKASNAKEERNQDKVCMQAMVRESLTRLKNRISEDKFDFSDASALLWLCSIKHPEIGKTLTSSDDLVEFMKFTNKDVEQFGKRFAAHKAFQPIIGFFEDETGQRCFFGKSKETAETDRESQTDESIIRKFLKEIFD